MKKRVSKNKLDDKKEERKKEEKKESSSINRLIANDYSTQVFRQKNDKNQRSGKN